jgi:hypothetical protein
VLQRGSGRCDVADLGHPLRRGAQFGDLLFRRACDGLLGGKGVESSEDAEDVGGGHLLELDDRGDRHR